MIKRLPIVFSFLIAFLFVGIKPLFASTLYLSPASGQIGMGGTLTVQVGINAGGDPVNGVTAVLSYPTDKLDVVSVRYGSSFPYGAEATGGGGIVKISAGSLNPVSSGSVGFVTFRGKALGTATVSFSAGSAAPRASDSSDSMNLGGSSGGTYTVSQSVPSATPAPSAKVTDVQAIDISSRSATITWKTTDKLNSVVEYGLDKGVYFLTTTNDTLVTDHKITLDSPLLVPGLQVHYRVKSQLKDASILSVSDDGMVQLIGYKVLVHLTDPSNKPLANTSVSLFSPTLEGVTDAQGEVTFMNVSPGNHRVAIKTNDSYQIKNVTIVDKDIEQPQRFDFQVAPSQQQGTESLNPLLLVLGVLLTIAPLVVLYLLKRQAAPPETQFPEQL